MTGASKPETFHIVMIKPSHYDDDGYPIQWLRSALPSNTLACLYGLADNARRRQVLGRHVDFQLHAYDETNRRVRPQKIMRMIRRGGARALIALVGVQSNQFPRAVDIARQFANSGFPVCLGGFHVSGCIAMLEEMPREIKEAQALGISLFAGEAEEQGLDELLLDAWNGKLKPLYNRMDALPALNSAPPPMLPSKHVRRTVSQASSADLGRGCPYQCSFCTIINVQGRKSRSRSPDDLEGLVRENFSQGINRYFITDDNFSRNREWEKLIDRLIALRVDDGIELSLSIQVDALCHRIPEFIEKTTAAGVQHVFIGLENINPDNLLAAKKRQNKITEYRKMLQKWREHGAITYAGYILGFPGDTKESILRDVEIIKNELPLDILQFSILTPLPGSEDHKTLLDSGVWMDPDLNKYDINHRVTHHPTMSDQEWEDAYWAAWHAYYTLDHVRTILRRAAANKRGRPEAMIASLLWFYPTIAYDYVHPMEGGAFRLKFRRDRRTGLRRENPLTFYARYLGETTTKIWRCGLLYRRYQSILKECLMATDRWAYRDLAISPVRDEELDSLELYRATDGGRSAVKKKRKEDAERDVIHSLT